MRLVVTNEHGGNKVPKEYAFLFMGKEDVLESPKAYDIGSADIFNSMKTIADFSLGNLNTRLLVDLNRSTHHPRVFSAFSKKLSPAERDVLLEKYYKPYRSKVVAQLENNRKSGEGTFHISVHTFHVLGNGKIQDVDVSLLYDPKKVVEHRAAVLFKKELLKRSPDLNIRFNFPVTGATDGFPPYLRKAFPESYAGIEMLVNQKLLKNEKFQDGFKEFINESWKEVYQRL
jgi:predicted N-formylglutamate amidohydrolase